MPWHARTTWGHDSHRDRVIDKDSTVYTRLTDAGAILVAKLSTGALAVTARWFGGITRCPWDTSQDASGSSAGPGAATAGGLVGFAIGTDTGGSIIGPSSRNGITGLRPTFGRVSREGGMVLAWTQDTVGPMCRSAEDCALVLHAIHGPDGRDNSVMDVPFNWDAAADVKRLRVGYLRSEFEGEIRVNAASPGNAEFERARRANNQAALDVIRSLGVDVVPFELPDVSIPAIDFIRHAETSAFFDDVTRSGELTAVERGPEQSTRPVEIRSAYFTPAVAFIQANRIARGDGADRCGDVRPRPPVGSRQDLTNRTTSLGEPAERVPSRHADRAALRHVLGDPRSFGWLTRSRA